MLIYGDRMGEINCVILLLTKDMLDHVSVFNALTANELIKLRKVKDVFLSLKLTFTQKRNVINIY